MSKYNPMSKEFQEEAKRLGLTGNQLINKYIQEGKIASTVDINRENSGRIAKNAGFKNHNEYNKHNYHENIEYSRERLRNWRHDNLIQASLSDNEDCAHYLGTHIAERRYGRIILPEMFGSIEKEMPYGYPKYDFIVTGDIKVDVKSCCLREVKGWIGWEPHVRYNNVTDYFVILVFDDRINLNLMHVWLIGKNEIIRGDKFYNRDNIKITNKYRFLLAFKRFDWIDKLTCLKIRDEKI